MSNKRAHIVSVYTISPYRNVSTRQSCHMQIW